jgi:hypothetical protein
MSMVSGDRVSLCTHIHRYIHTYSPFGTELVGLKVYILTEDTTYFVSSVLKELEKSLTVVLART